jgi:3'-phosphoadenosine 5'-phosphosulfate sulfotransferase (PAPS reductase)/FAD synthetase
MIINLVSVSGGKDSTATLIKALKEAENVMAVFADTGHEHAQTYEYIEYLKAALSIDIITVKANFDDRIKKKRLFIANDQRSGRKNGKKIRWTNKAKRRALAVLKPTGNPFLDLCLWKGRFPSTKARFCSSELKHNPLDEYAQSLMQGGNTVISWQGVRADESLNRRDLPEKDIEFGQWEPEPKGLLIYRPIITWTASDVFAYHAENGITPNPLYMQGMGRVGCMPCIHARKDELRNIAMRFPAEIERVKEWEFLVAEASKHLGASFFAHADNRGLNISESVEWSKTTRGAKNYDLINLIEENSPMTCSSLYGLCE